jgi:long-chain acyl-CoA synthetase
MTEIGETVANLSDTWPKVLKYNCEKYGVRHKAMRYKHYGIWQSYSWKDYYEQVKYLALGLLSLGFEDGDRLLIIGDNAPEWYFAELAVQSNHGISVGLYSDLGTSEIKYIAANSQSSFAIVEDQEQVDKLLEVEKDLPNLKKIIYWNYKGLSDYKNPSLIGYRELVENGHEYAKTHPNLFEEKIASGKADDVCLLVYSSGSTGDHPNGSIHSFRSIRYGSECHLLKDKWTKDDNIISYLPPAWIAEQWLSFGCHLLTASIINFCESAETQQQDIREIAPTMIFYSARLWERQAGSVQSRVRGSDTLKRTFYRWLMPVGFKLADLKLKKHKPGLGLRVQNLFANFLVFRPIRDSLGLTHAKICYTAGTTLSPEAIRFYHALNVPLKSLYGTTENGALTGAPYDDIRLDTVGTLNRGTEIRIEADGSILSRQPGSFLGYYNNPSETARILKNGWVQTGDSGRFTDGGHLVFIDRTKDIIKFSTGELAAPQEIESRLKINPYIKDAWVFGGPNSTYLSAVIIIDNNSVGKWADKRKITYTTLNDLSQKPEVYNLIEQEIKQINADLPSTLHIKKFINFNKEFDADELELTRNRKMRRGFIANRYDSLVQAIYNNQKDITLEAQVTYGDGRTGYLKTSLQIKEVESK